MFQTLKDTMFFFLKLLARFTVFVGPPQALSPFTFQHQLVMIWPFKAEKIILQPHAVGTGHVDSENCS
jgi:hypothetical protein